MPKIKLFFIPHAGGSAMGYMALKKFLDTEFIEPIPMEPAGRGRRIKEPCFMDVKDSADDLYEKMKEEAGGSDYAIFGHSLGSLLAFEVTRRIYENKEMKQPKCLFLSGRCAPTYGFPYPALAGLEDAEFIEKFSSYQAMPNEFLQNEQIMKMMLPIVRADINMAEAYRYEACPQFGCDLIAMYGSADTMVNKEGADAWAALTKGSFYQFKFMGGHFYYSEHKRQVGEQITKMLKQYT